jgi:radical SAM superfamily enzyme YgiQ (UPF0313 family)
MPDIVLTTLNARYIHAAFGLRYLMANLGELKPGAAIVEFDINQRPLDIAEMLLAREPKILGFGVYIWNVTETAEVIAAIKRVRPEVIVVLGGPEVSYETEEQAIVALGDYVITGEADLKFAEVCRQLLNGEKPATKIIAAPPPEFGQLELPYDLYTEQDVAHRVIYVEASRGCPFTCEFCLSSLDIPVRQVPLERMLAALQRLLDRGVKQFKFVDRTFNLNLNVSRALLQFFLERYEPGWFLHFEMIPDRLPEALREIIARFPPGALQFEVGIQSFNDEVCQLISRRQDLRKLEDNFQFLRGSTGVHIHADLIVGLPGETIESFGAGFDRLIALGPQEIQVGILKRLRGTPIVRHDDEWRMRYNPSPPYEILLNKLIDFATMQRLRRFAKYWDLVGNSGNFVETTPLLWSLPSSATAPESDEVRPSPGAAPRAGESALECSTAGGQSNVSAPEDGRTPQFARDGSGAGRKRGSAFASFLRWSDWLHARTGRTDSIALARLAELLFMFLTSELRLDERLVVETLWRDWQRGGRADKPEFLRARPAGAETHPAPRGKTPLPKRQSRHGAVA